MNDIAKIKSLIGKVDKLTDAFGISEKELRTQARDIMKNLSLHVPEYSGEVGVAMVLLEKVLGVDYTAQQLFDTVLVIKGLEYAIQKKTQEEEAGPFSDFGSHLRANR
jgi:hypothetical protein